MWGTGSAARFPPSPGPGALTVCPDFPLHAQFKSFLQCAFDHPDYYASLLAMLSTGFGPDEEGGDEEGDEEAAAQPQA